jgi:hypothetical protein
VGEYFNLGSEASFLLCRLSEEKSPLALSRFVISERSGAADRVRQSESQLPDNHLLAVTRMAPPWLSTLASIGMAVGPPLVYVDQTTSIIKKKYALLLSSRIHRSFDSSIQRFYGVFSRHLCSPVRKF